MSSTRLSLLLAAATLVGGCRGGESEEPPVHLIQNMYTQEKAKPYRKDDTGLFPDGRTMHLPVEGTVAIGQLNDDSHYDDGIDPMPKLIDGGTSMVAAVAFAFPTQVMETDGGIGDELVERGHLRFNIYCQPCHGITGAGDGELSKKAHDGGTRLDVAPANLLDPRVKDMPVGQIFAAMTKGVNGGNMPSYATQIPVRDRWAIAAYLRTLQKVGFDGKPPEPPPSDDKITVSYGQWIWKNRGCNACHSLDGSKIVGPSWKGIYGKTEKTSAGDVTIDDAYIAESVLQPKAKIVDGYAPVMPDPTSPFSDNALKSIALFIKSLQ